MGIMFGFVILIVLLVVFKLYGPQIKGHIGEQQVSGLLSFLPAEKYRVVNNIMIKTENGTSQIDHVVVSIYGIFVIETKNYKGWIYGSEYGDNWVKNVYGKKYHFYNPLKQNYSHIDALSKLLKMSKDEFVGIVAFGNGAELKTEKIDNVVYFGELETLIKSYTNIKLGSGQVEDIFNKLIDSNIDSRANRDTHIQKIGVETARKSEKLKMGICPRCGGKLVKRNGKYGSFTGCSNYPKCRFTSK